jgi:hypothetical protein
MHRPRGRGGKNHTTAAITGGSMGAAHNRVRQPRARNQQRRSLLELPDHLVHGPTKFRMDCKLKRGDKGTGI